ncbi:MAG TPA: hypothetical protein VNT99_15015, partial [Methylomirabilota bacterium]|nr:hypothetical protein [Methylomirabilota bacterium]
MTKPALMRDFTKGINTQHLQMFKSQTQCDESVEVWKRRTLGFGFGGKRPFFQNPEGQNLEFGF